jgi:hypothetical protein
MYERVELKCYLPKPWWVNRFVIVEVYEEVVDLGVNIFTLSYVESMSSFMALYVQYI